VIGEMSIEHPEMDVVEELPWKHDPRWQLVQRILESPDFVRSPQLSKFLLYICTATLDGRVQNLSEQHIGVEVFGRAPDYDSAADTIVRSHALRLRRRLEQFFQRSGGHEPLLLIIPRGGYVPVFLASSQSPGAVRNQPEEQSHSQDSDSVEPSAQSPHALHAAEESTSSNWATQKPSAGVLWRYRIATTLLACICIGLIVVLGLHLRTHFAAKRHHLLWGALFTDDQPTHIVLGDSGLVLFHAVTRKRVSLQDYLSDDVSKQMPYVQRVEPGFAQFLLHRRYTSMVDATTLSHLLRLPEAIPERTLVHYSRDMHPNDFKTGNVIILGAQEAVPWVELFENRMDFEFSIDHPDTHASFLNRHPASGELNEYSSYTPATKTKAYAVFAFLPNLSATGNVLILEGLSMVGTEAAVDLEMDDDRLLPLLAKIRKPDGSLPHFELLLESDSLGESAGPARVVAMHLHD
jgi:hypothetical protein